MQIISPKIPYIGYSRNAEHDYLFNKLVEAISKEFATKHNFLAYHQRMTAALADVADIVNTLYIQSTVLAPDEETLAEVTAIATTVNALISQYTLVLSRRGVGKTTDAATPDEGGTDTPEPEPEPEEPDGGDEGEGGSPL